MDLIIDHEENTAPYEQLRRQITDAIVTGDLPAGARLPTVRQLATDLGLAVNTVAKTYRQLEAAGLVETLGRRGTLVTSSVRPGDEAARQAAQLFVAQIRDLGIDADEAVVLVREAFQR